MRLKPLASMLVALSIGVAGVASARDFRSSDNQPPDFPTVEAVRVMGKNLKEQSGGKLGIKVYPNAALGAERDTIEQLKIGGLDMMRINAAVLNNIVPETIAISLPFVFQSTQHMCVFGGAMIYNGLMLGESVIAYKIPNLALPEAVRYAPLVISGVLIILFSMEHIVALLRGEEVEPSWH